jgi:hypothetical protein
MSFDLRLALRALRRQPASKRNVEVREPGAIDK